MTLHAHPVLGEITLNPSAKARRVSISVRPGGEVRLTIPRRISQAEALRFLDEKAAWVEKARRRVAARHAQPLLAPPYATRSHVLYLDPCACRTIRVRVAEGRITVSYPAQVHYEAEEVQAAIRKGIEEAWRLEARTDLPQRVERLCRATGLRCGQVSVRNSRTRWGSCSPRDDLSLSLHLMKLTDALIDYIILHELCHTKYKNHGPRFHALLDKLCGGRDAELKRELRAYATRW